MKDWRGNEIEVGDTVLYPFAWGNSGIEMAEAKVVEIRPTTVIVTRTRKSRSEFYSWEDPDRRITLRTLRNITKVS